MGELLMVWDGKHVYLSQALYGAMFDQAYSMVLGDLERGHTLGSVFGDVAWWVN